jgi:hypothetical protein
MSQIEQQFREYLNRHPEIRAAKDLINVRAVARNFMIEEGISKKGIEAVVATIRRCDFKKLEAGVDKKIFSEIKVNVKDEIVILDYDKSKTIFEKLKSIIENVSYDKSETLKVVVGSQNVKVIVDSSNKSKIKQLLGTGMWKEYKDISEISLLFSSKALTEKGIVAYVANELLVNGINIREIMTCTPELIFYVDEKESLKAYEIVKKMKHK